jgi:hypothetical protein
LEGRSCPPAPKNCRQRNRKLLHSVNCARKPTERLNRRKRTKKLQEGMLNAAKTNKKNKKRLNKQHNAKKSRIFAGRSPPLPKLPRRRKAAP